MFSSVCVCVCLCVSVWKISQSYKRIFVNFWSGSAWPKEQILVEIRIPLPYFAAFLPLMRLHWDGNSLLLYTRWQH